MGRLKVVVLVVGVLIVILANLIVSLGAYYSPKDQTSATEPACRLLPAHRVNQTLSASGHPGENLGNREERQTNYQATPAYICGYFGQQFFGRDGGEYVRLYVANFPPLVSPQGAIRDFADDWFEASAGNASRGDYSLESRSGVGDEAWDCVTPSSLPFYLCLAADHKSVDGVRMAVVFVSGKQNVAVHDPRPLAILVESVLSQM
jgi:hypothetical protein